MTPRGDPESRSDAFLAAVFLAAFVLAVPASSLAADRLFIINSQRDVATVVDPSTGDLAEVELSDGLRANRVTMSVDGRQAYIWGYPEHVSVIDTATRRLVSKMESIKDRVVIFPLGTSFPQNGTAGVWGDDGRLIEAIASSDYLVSAFDPASQRLYHGSQHYNVLLAIEPPTGTVTARIALDDSPRRLMFSTDGSRLFVVHSHSITAIDTDSHAATQPLHINGGVDDLELTPDGALGFATKQGSDLLTVVDLNSWRAVDYLRIDAAHTDVAVSNDSRRLYYAAPGNLSIVDLATMTPAGMIAGGGGGTVLLAAGGTRAFVIGFGLALFDLQRNELITTMALDSYPNYALTRDGSELYVIGDPHGRTWAGSVLRIIEARTGEVLETFADDHPENIQTAPDGRIYVTQPASRIVRILDPQTAETAAVIPPLELGDGIAWSPIDVAFTSDPDVAFVTYTAPSWGYDDEHTSAIGVYRVGDQVLEKVAVWGPDFDESPFYSWDLVGPSHIAVKPDGSEAYVVTESPALVVVDMNTQSLSGVIDIAIEEDWISDLAITPDGSKVYATRWYQPLDGNDQSLVVVDTATKEISQTVPLPGNGSYGIAIPPDGSRAFVAMTRQDREVQIGPIEHLVSAIDIASDTVTSTLALETVTDAWSTSSHIAASPDGNTVYATLWTKGLAVAIDTETNALLGTFGAGEMPERLAVSSALAFAPLPTSSPTPTPTPTVVPAEIPVLPHLDVPALSLDEGVVTYTDADRSTPVALDGTPVAVLADPASRSGYIIGVSTWEAEADAFETRVWRITDGQAESVASLLLRAAPERAAISPDGRLLYVASRLLSSSPYEHHWGYGFDTVVTVIDVATAAWRTTATLEGLACGVTAAPDGEVQVVTNRQFHGRGGRIASERNETIVTTFAAATHYPVERSVIAGSCYEAALSPDGDRLAIVGNDDVYRSRHLTVVDLGDRSANEMLLPELSPGPALLWSSGSEVVYLSGGPGLVGLDAETGAITRVLNLTFGPGAVSTSPRNPLSYLSTYEGGVVVFDRLLGRFVGKAPSLRGRVTALCTECVASSEPPQGVPIDSLPSVPPLLFPPPPTDPAPSRGPHWIQVDDAVADPGDRVELGVTLYSEPFATGMSAELWLPQGVTFAPWVDGKPDCELTPEIDRFEDRTIVYLPSGCSPGIDCSGVFLDVSDTSRLNFSCCVLHTIFRCRVDLDESLFSGAYSLQVRATMASALWYGEESRDYWPVPGFDGTLVVGGGVPTPTATASATPSSPPPTATSSASPETATETPSRVLSSATPTSTPTAGRNATTTPTLRPRTGLLIDPVSVEAGSAFTFAVRLGGAALDVAGVQNDLEIDPGIYVRRCTVNRAIGKSGFFAFSTSNDDPAMTTCPPGAFCDRLRAIVLSYEDTSAIAKGRVLYTCKGEIPESTPPGHYSLRLSGVVASDAHGGRIEGDAFSGTVDVRPPVDGATEGVGQSGARSTGGCDLRKRSDSPLELAYLAVPIILLALRWRPRSIGRG